MQSTVLIDIVKQALKSHQLTYADVGRALDMSEANVKRQFASKRFTLDRLEAICRIMDMDLADLFKLFDDSRQRITQLTYEQEEELIKDTKLLLVAVGIRNHLTYTDLVQHYQLTEAECIQCLAQLDRLKIIDLLPNNRIKLRVAEDFRWLPYGPIERFFELQLQAPFLNSQFTAETEQRLFLYGLLSESSIQYMDNKIQLLAKEFTELLREDVSLPLSKRYSIGMLLAMRPWEADMFQALARDRHETNK